MIKNIKLTYSARVCILCLAVISVLVGCNGNKQEAAETSSQLAVASTNIGIWPKLDIAVKADADIEEKVASLLVTMTL